MSDMKLLIVITSILGLSLAQFKVTCNCGNAKAKRIVGGNDATHEYPWMVSLLYSSSYIPFCAGTIITSWHVLSSANCIVGKSPAEILLCVGIDDVTVCMDQKHKSVKEKIMEVYAMTFHEKFHPDKKINDISVIVTKNEISFSPKVAAACFPDDNFKGNFDEETFKAMAWGNSNMLNQLQEVDVKVFSNEECKEKHHSDVEKRIQFCTTANSGRICFGDYGGPLMWMDPDIDRYTVVGVMSYSEKLCFDDTIPSVNTNVYQYIHWVPQQIKGEEQGWVTSYITRIGKLCTKVQT